MKKKGILFIILIIVVVIALIVGLFAILFSINSIEIEKTNNFNKINSTELQTYVNKSLGKNAFAFNKAAFKADVEKKFPYAEIEQIEMVFPSKVIVTVKERMPLFTVNYNSQYYFFDNNGFLIGVGDSNTGGDGDYSSIEIEGIKASDLAELSIEAVGTTLDTVTSNKTISSVMKFFDILNGLTFEYTDIQIKGFFSSVEVDTDNNLTATTRYGIKLCIYDFDEMTETKVINIMGAYTSGMASDPTSTIIIGNNLTPVLSN